MSKKYEREIPIIDRLEKENRELKSENRRLFKLVRRLNKGFYKLLDEEVVEEQQVPEEVVKECWDCGKGKLLVRIVLNRRWRECDVCDKRTKVKII
jgi:predicted nuclease with TOPRIM domain